MKTNRALGLAIVLTFTSLAGLALMPGCSGNQADVVYGADGAVLGDGGITPTVDTGIPTTSMDTGTMTTFIDSGSTTTPDTGTTTTPDTGTTTTPDTGTGGTCPPATCAQDSDCACLTASGSIGCCDTVTTACFQSASSTCPDQQGTGTGSGTGGY